LKTAILIISFFIVSSTFAQEQLTRILFILDASNSMNEKWSVSETRIEAAKDLLSKSIDSLRGTPNLEVALRVYGHQSPITADYQDCNDTKLEVPFSVDNFDAINSKIKSISAKGTTPIARSLEAAASDFPDTNSRNIIILITDGLEACDNDPCVIAKKLKDKGVKVKPFVIGLGMDLSYLEKFNCIGTYSDAENRTALQSVLTTVLSKIVYNTTVQINLNDINKKPNETNVTMFLYEAGTNNLKYTFVHTINKFGNPDTLIIDPKIKYDLVVNTLPKLEKKDIVIYKNVHNTIVVDAPQGFIKLKHSNATKPYPLSCRVMENGKCETINVQQSNQTDKYIVGKYNVELLTLPRKTITVDVSQSTTTTIDVLAPGNLSYSTKVDVVAQLFALETEGKDEWVCNLDTSNKSGMLQLQPGKYKIVYRYLNKLSSKDTSFSEFTISSNKTTTIYF
jgi:Ca-activated chloride channel family protein